MSLILNKLAGALPDIPSLVETRSTLLSGNCDLIHVAEQSGPSFVIRHTLTGLLCVYGTPPSEVIADAASHPGPGVLVTPTTSAPLVASALPEWTREEAIVHRLRADAPLPSVPEGAVRVLTGAELESAGIPEELRGELIVGVRTSLVAAAIAGEAPVSFCYSCHETETLWDISIDTLAEHRRRGYAALCVSYMIRLMWEQGKQPVWGALKSNVASLALAARLGFEPVEPLAVFERKGSGASSEGAG